MFTQAHTTLALERQAGGVQKHYREIGEQVAAALEQPLLDQIGYADQPPDPRWPGGSVPRSIYDNVVYLILCAWTRAEGENGPEPTDPRT